MADIFRDISASARSALLKVFGYVNNTDGKPSVSNDDQEMAKAMASLGGSNAMSSVYTAYVRHEMERKAQYKEYDSMEEESEVISTALDIYAEDATDFDTFVGARLWITSGKDDIEKEANDLIKRVKLEKNLPRLARNLGKHGDFFLGVKHDRPENKNGNGLKRSNLDTSKLQGVTHVDTSYYPRDVMPVVRDYKLLGYLVQDMEQLQSISAEQLKAPWEFVHFAVPGDSNFLSYDSNIDYTTKRGDMVEYGQSLLRAARKPYKRSKLMHDILAIARITRSPLKRVFKFMTDTNNPVSQITALAMFKKTMEKIGGIDKLNDTMNYDELMNVMTQDIFLPVGKDSKGDYSFQTIGGEVDVKAIADIDLFDNRLFMSLRIPKTYLNFDEATGDKATLLLKDIRYAKRIRKLQNAIRHGVRDLIFIHFALKGIVLKESDFEVNMASTSVSDDLNRLDYYNNAIQTADALIRMLDSFMVKVEPDIEGNPVESDKYDRNYLAYYILKHVVKLPSFDLDKFNPRLARFAKVQEESIVGKSTAKFVEDNKKLIENMLHLGSKRDLTEAAEEVNSNIIKSYKREPIKDFKFDHEGLRNYLENVIKRSEKRSGAADRAVRIIE